MTNKKTSKFIQVQDTFVNLDCISNVNPLQHRLRIVFNFSYPVVIKVKGKPKLVSEYLYDDYELTTDFQAAVVKLMNHPYVKEHFISQGPRGGLINKDKISSFKVQPNKNRVIFNMSHSIEIDTKDTGSTVAPEFIYVTLKTEKDYNDYIQYLNENLV